MVTTPLKALINFLRAARGRSQSDILKEFLRILVHSNDVSESGSLVVNNKSRELLELFNPEDFLFTEDFLSREDKWQFSFRYDEGIAGLAFRTRRTQHVSDVIGFPSFTSKEGPVPIVNIVCTPIILHEGHDPFAVASFHNSTQQRQFDEEDIHFIEIYAESLGMVLKSPKPEPYSKLHEPIRQFYGDSERSCQDYDKNVFIMTRFQQGNDTLEQIDQTIRSTLAERGLVGHRADDRCYPVDRNLWDNVCTYMFCCNYGIAVLENIIVDEFNPNVALEFGFMRALDKPTLLLKEVRFKPRADILGTLWQPFDILHVENSVAKAINGWLDDLDSHQRT